MWTAITLILSDAFTCSLLVRSPFTGTVKVLSGERGDEKKREETREEERREKKGREKEKRKLN